ncbi:MAG: NAD(P)H-dependent oxidoreductase subunit E [Syntrophales bacterium]|jgi:NADH-quinone oxidoreductase subunit E/NADP-reducing hydrogenase subunit HndA|nr:NAD(P)H-dependent oxidoreductase subunit E [Syntrophales bacterium]MCK9527839.1 NAD(P)H-dependent oxidoreductase subunit E [Syntrophales bacterium]MDX9922064.1 NAD(P)H-dependent oxidoreductase subunit E [Syntrophales bacterium]
MEELSMHILDIVENSTRAGSRLVSIGISESTVDDSLIIDIQDDGSGMDGESLRRALDPFYTTKEVRRVGLGLPLLAQAAETTGGSFSITSEADRGTRVRALFRLNHVDRQPLGRMEQTLTTLMMGNPEVDFVYCHSKNGRSYTLDTRELRRSLEDVPLTHTAVMAFIRSTILENLAELEGDSPDIHNEKHYCFAHGGPPMKSNDDMLLEEFSQEQIQELDATIEAHKSQPGGLIPVLEKAQELLGFLPVPVQQRIAGGLNLPLSQVYGVVTFYSLFTMTPRGRNTIRICLGTACYVRGGKKIAENIERMLAIKEGETTPDRRFTYESVRCLGACGLGPVVVVNDDVHGRVKPDRIKQILENYQ